MNIKQQLEGIFHNRNDKNIKPLGLGKALIHYIAQDSVNKYDGFAGVTGLQVGVASKVNEILTRSDFKNKLKRLGYLLSKGNDDYAMVTYIINGLPYIDFVKVAQSRTIAGVLVELVAHTEDMIKYNETNVPVYTYWRKDGDVITKGQRIYVDEVATVIGEDIIYPGKTIPGTIFYNNSLHTGDVPKAIYDLVVGLDYFGDELPTEWTKVRTQFINNMLFNSKDGQSWSADQKAGVDVHDVNDPDSKLGGAIAPMISGSTTSVTLLQQIEFLEDKILKYSFTMRDTTSTSAQKGTQEVSGMNQAEYEYMIAKLEFRQEQLYKFFNTFFDLLMAAGLIANKPKNYTLSIKMSDIEAFKRDNMNATLALKVGQANQFEATAKNQEAQAIANLREPVETPQGSE